MDSSLDPRARARDNNSPSFKTADCWFTRLRNEVHLSVSERRDGQLNAMVPLEIETESVEVGRGGGDHYSAPGLMPPTNSPIMSGASVKICNADQRQ